MAAPKKYVKINGIMKLNPEYKKWKEQQNNASGAPGAPATTVAEPDIALPVVTSMDDYEQFNDVNTANGGAEVPLSESTAATIEMMQEPEICVEAGMTPETMVDELGQILNKYEVPLGLMNKLLMLSEYQCLDFLIDDSGSMTLMSDTVDPATGRPQTRWQEALRNLKEMLEVLAYVPFNQIEVGFLNRPDRIILTRQGKDPKSFLADAYGQIDRVFAKPPSGTTPAWEKLQESFAKGAGMSIARYFMGDGIPNGGVVAQQNITKMLVNRPNPEQNPMTFISCTNEDAAVEWMKDAEEVAPYCSESDDFQDESREVLRDQGAALPYTKGFHLICQLVAAMNPHDLDAMDESVPFTKATLDNLLGIQHDATAYRHYFDQFKAAQQKRTVEGQADTLKKNQNWEASFQDFLQAPMANQIPAVQQFQQQLKQMVA